MTSLMKASTSGNVEIMKMLLQKGANVNHPDKVSANFFFLPSFLTWMLCRDCDCVKCAGWGYWNIQYTKHLCSICATFKSFLHKCYTHALSMP